MHAWKGEGAQWWMDEGLGCPWGLGVLACFCVIEILPAQFYAEPEHAVAHKFENFFRAIRKNLVNYQV